MLAVSIALLVILMSLFLVLTRLYRRVNAKLLWFESLFVPGNDGTSEVARFFDAMAAITSQRMAATVEGRIMAHRGHLTRQENALAADAVNDLAANQSPLLAGVLDLMPSVKKRIAKNPSALQAIMPMLMKVMEGQKGGSDNEEHSIVNWDKYK